MRDTNATFDTEHAKLQKQPLYLVHFEGETLDFSNHLVANSTYDCLQYVRSISGAAQTVTPEEGRASIGGIKVSLVDPNIDGELIYVDNTTYYVDDETIDVTGGDPIVLTRLLATDAFYFHRKKTTIKAGYQGMSEADMLTVFSGWVTDLQLSSDGICYEFTLTDPQKWMQRKVFRSAHTSTVTIGGNPLTVLLKRG